MVNAQAVHHASVDQLKDQPVRIVEDRIIFNPDADQPGDLKEAPPRELLRRLRQDISRQLCASCSSAMLSSSLYVPGLSGYSAS
jgi:hypothetical protein